MKKLVVMFCAVCLVLGVSGTTHANLITNGDFSDGLNDWTVNNPNHVSVNSNNVAVLNVEDGDGWAVLTQEFYVDPNLWGISIEFNEFQSLVHSILVVFSKDHGRTSYFSFSSQPPTFRTFTHLSG